MIADFPGTGHPFVRLDSQLTAVALILALAGCVSSGGLHPNGTLLDPASLEVARSLPAMPSLAPWPALDWWSGLGDPQLDRLISDALGDNPDLAVADARTRAAQAQVGAANAERGPSVNGGAAAAGARLPATVLPPEAGGGHFMQSRYAYLHFAWGLDLWGGKRAAWEAALGQARAAEIDARAARIELSANIARAYVQLGYAFAQQEVARAERQRAARARALTAQRVAAGIDSQLQIKQNDGEVASADKDLAMAARAIESARSALSVLLGRGPDRGLQIDRPRILAPAAVAVPANLPVDLIGHRADLVAARWRVQAAAKSIKVAKTQFLPNLSLGAFAGLIASGGHSLFELPARFYELGPSLSLPIFDGGKLRSNLAGKDAEYDLAVAQYNQTLVNAVNQVADRLAGADSLRAQIAAQQRSLDAARQAWHLAQLRYKAGIGSFLEALSVRQQLLVAESAMAGLKAQQVDLSVQLIEALGGGYRPDGQAPVSPGPALSRSSARIREAARVQPSLP